MKDTKYTWVCPKGHEYDASPQKRNNGSGCPICTHEKVLSGVNDLLTRYPSIAKQWDLEANHISPDQVFPKSNRKMAWIGECGHKWKASVASRTSGEGCPYCNNKKPIKGETDLATCRPDLLEEWDYKKNRLKPEEYSVFSNNKVWWICKNGHSYYASICGRTKAGLGCNQCRKMRE